ncbi:MAG: dethiobiotin synthase [Calditrichia bacterium]
MKQTIFITAIDTEIGKTVVTGFLAKYLKDRGGKVITQKIIQTGCKGIAEDIKTHREIMGTGLLEVDLNKDTCPMVFELPASPHLAAALEDKEFDQHIWFSAHQRLLQQYDLVLLEGVGGLFVPLTRDLFLIDWLAQYKFQTILVTSPRLGSINHTFLSIEALQSRSIPLAGMVYNHHVEEDPNITTDTLRLFKEKHPDIPIVEMPKVKDFNNVIMPDFSVLC